VARTGIDVRLECSSSVSLVLQTYRARQRSGVCRHFRNGTGHLTFQDDGAGSIDESAAPINEPTLTVNTRFLRLKQIQENSVKNPF
jgi:hypothetical protein